jgi:hypothetical protein
MGGDIGLWRRSGGRSPQQGDGEKYLRRAGKGAAAEVGGQHGSEVVGSRGRWCVREKKALTLCR